MLVKATFSDLTHTGQVVAANTFPFGVALVASHVQKTLGEYLDIELFKYPEDLAKSLEEQMPKIAAFSCYLWNIELSCAFAKELKKRDPTIVIIFGGPNFPVDQDDQLKFLLSRPEIDFYIQKEGEIACANLLLNLQAHDFSVEEFKSSGKILESVHYIYNGIHKFGRLADRMHNLSDTPSPYLSGMMDKFFDGVLIPTIETNRGCPFQCSFCIEGVKYYNKVRWNTQERIGDEISYISDRTTNPDLLITDSNFGMYKEDLETCKIINYFQTKKNWPRYVQNSSGKNQKERVIEAARILNGAMILTVSIQSADEIVLKNVRRSNISVEQIVEVGKKADLTGANSYSEIILGLPGDSREAHFRSVMTMIDADINDVLTYQTMMLPGTDIESPDSRKNHEMQTKWRVLPRCFGIYNIFDRTIPVAEVEEICISNKTLSFDDYLECRRLSLTVELFHNSGVFSELACLLKLYGIKRSEFIETCHELAFNNHGLLRDLYINYLHENESKLWDERQSLLNWVLQPDIISRHISGELGSGELYKFRAIAFFSHMADLHVIAFNAARQLLKKEILLHSNLQNYLGDLEKYSLFRKENLINTDMIFREIFNFDFFELEKNGFKVNPLDYSNSHGHELMIAHDESQKSSIQANIKQYGMTIDGLGRMLLRSHVNKLYRKPHKKPELEQT